MTKHQIGPKNGQWKGGRIVASNGYVLVRVGVGHHLADVRGYAYEHRIEAERKLGRRLRSGEQVHHLDHDKTNNDHSNLEVMSSLAEHRLQHRKEPSSRRLPEEQNHSIACACGCGQQLDAFDRWGRRRRFVSGHNGRKTA